MEERKPMYEFDLGFMGKVICSADTATLLMPIINIAGVDASKREMTGLSKAYRKISNDICNSLEEIGYYCVENEIL